MMRFVKYSAVGLLTLSVLSAAASAAKKKDTDDTSTVKGVVQNADKEAVKNATVRLLHREDDKLAEVDTHDHRSDGTFKFNDVHDGTFVVVAFRKSMRDRTTVTVDHDKKVPVINFALKQGEVDADETAAAASTKGKYVTLSGVVYDKSKDPIKGAKVQLLTGSGRSTDTKVIDTDTTDSKGRFEFVKAPGDYFIEVAGDGKTGSRKEVTLKAGDKTEKVDLVSK